MTSKDGLGTFQQGIPESLSRYKDEEPDWSGGSLEEEFARKEDQEKQRPRGWNKVGLLEESKGQRS